MERLLAQLRAQPGVITAGLTSSLPMGGDYNNSATSIEG